MAENAGCELPMTGALACDELEPPLPKQMALGLSAFALFDDQPRQTEQVAPRSVVVVDVLFESEFARPVHDAGLLICFPLLRLCSGEANDTAT